MKRASIPCLAAALVVAAASPAAWAADAPGSHAGMHYEQRFERIATFANYRAVADPTTETVSEIVAATEDGSTLVYTDSEREAVTLVDIGNATDPRPLASVTVDGEPTSVAVLGNDTALVSVDTSASYTRTSGRLLLVDISDPASPRVSRRLELGGQPDAVAVSPDGRYTAIAIENERDETVCIGGRRHGEAVPEDDAAAAERCSDGGGVPGGLPQTDLGNPPGYLAVVDNRDYSVSEVALTGLAGYAPGDPEPEFVDIDERNHAAVTMQENNHVAVVDLATGEVVSDFAAGEVALGGIDTTEDGVISASEAAEAQPREPDAITWLAGGDGARPLLATANEGDLHGGTRGFTIFDTDGRVVFDSGSDYERLAVRHGHYPERRSEDKGTEPEGVAYASFGHDEYLFVSSERGSFVAVYELWGETPRFVQLLPGPLGPEGVLPIPGRNLLVVSGEEDDPELGVRSTMMLYRLRGGAPSYPQIVSSRDSSGRPIGWSALSGLAAVEGDRLLAVEDSFFSGTRMLSVDASERPAVITAGVRLHDGPGDYDAEGIVVAPDGTRWLASEGAGADGRPNRLVQVDAGGRVLQTVELPERIARCRRASTETANLDNGFEGVSVEPHGDGYRLIAAQQLPWDYTTEGCEDLDDEAGTTRLWRYDPATGAWDHIVYELADVPARASWVGLSEITRAPDGSYVLIERDNRTGDFAGIKQLVRITPAAMADGRIRADEKETMDLLPRLRATDGWITDKPEGFAVTDAGAAYLVTDNDGVDGWSGETTFLPLGEYRSLFGHERE